MAVPIRVKRRHWSIARRFHPIYSRRPFALIRQIEDQQVFFRRRLANRVTALMRELEMVKRTSRADHDTIEALVIFERPELFEAHPFDVEAHYVGKSIGRASNA